mmetsp:Transcript_35494/g.57982  ORF Transcript_35494/g.57982 Transcript_35494/m.57982 type:complete len:207 (-) Transcript_35494:22-642(-)
MPPRRLWSQGSANPMERGRQTQRHVGRPHARRTTAAVQRGTVFKNRRSHAPRTHHRPSAENSVTGIRPNINGHCVAPCLVCLCACPLHSTKANALSHANVHSVASDFPVLRVSHNRALRVRLATFSHRKTRQTADKRRQRVARLDPVNTRPKETRGVVDGVAPSGGVWCETARRELLSGQCTVIYRAIKARQQSLEEAPFDTRLAV